MASTPSPSPHKLRRKAKKAGSDVANFSGATKDGPPSSSSSRPPAAGRAGGGANAGASAVAPGRPAYPLAALLWPARGKGPVSQWESLPLILMAVGLFRWAAGLWGYSGFRSPPMHGDYEAQRHWMEVTTALPVSQWYFHDLEWWGLDYPPLTAYHSWLLGTVGRFIDPKWFALYTSRGLDDPALKVFMRASVIVSEYLIFVPAAVIFVRRFSRFYHVHAWDASIALVAILMQPATILIDHVHFQYNTVMLGFVLASMSSVLAGRLLWSCVFFVAALGFKQMALYYAPAIFAYLLGFCVFPRINFLRLLGISLVTLASFAILVLPLYLGAMYDRSRGIEARPELFGYPAPLPLLGGLSFMVNPRTWYYPILQQTTQLLFRIFPFARGIFEDKVANFWCALNIIVKLKNQPIELLQRASLLATLAAIAPPCFIIFLKPRKELLPLALASTAWAFFLFSFQVHEKSVLLPLMPMTVLLASRDGLNKQSRAWIVFANLLAVWTLFPLLQRVDLRVPYYVLSLLWAYLLGLPPTSLSAYHGMAKTWSGLATIAVHTLFYVAMVTWHVLEASVFPPTRFPDLWVVVNVGVGTVGFMLCYARCVACLAVESGLFTWASRGETVKPRKVKAA